MGSDTEADERRDLRLRKLAIENAIKQLRLRIRRKEVIGRSGVKSGVASIMNDVRMQVEWLVETVGCGIDPQFRDGVTEKWRLDLAELLKQAAGKATEGSE